MARVRDLVSSDDEMPEQLIGRHQGKPASGHRHLKLLPCDADGDGVLDQLLVGASGGFDPAVRAGLEQLEQVRVRRKLVVRLEPMELPADLSTPSTTFASTTPFVCPRYPKLRRGRPRRDPEGTWAHGPEQQLRFLLDKAGLPAPVPLRAEDVRFGVWVDGQLVPWAEFTRTRRHGGGRRGLRHGFGFHLTFPCPIRGPLSSGYASHFGLGQFHPV